MLVATIAADKSGELSNVSNNTLGHVRAELVFGFDRENIFFQKHLFVSREKTNKQDDTMFNQAFSFVVL